MKTVKDPDEQKGAVEGTRPHDDGQGNQNAPGLDEGGLPNDPIAIGQDVPEQTKTRARGRERLRAQG